MGFALAEVTEALSLISGLARRTPLIETRGIGADLGYPLLLMLETLQSVGALKIRGAAHALLRLDEEAKKRGVVCCSTGNHGRAVAYAASRLGIPATICLSDLVPKTKVDAIAALGAKVERCGSSQDDAQRQVDRLVSEKGLTDISPFDHRDVILGQGTIALELLKQRPELSLIIVLLSGGGLIGGIACAAKALKPSIRITGVSMDKGAAMHESLKVGRPKAKAEACAQDIAMALKIKSQAVTDAAHAVGEAQLVVTTTAAKKPILRAEWLHKGLHITAMGSDQAGKNEIDPRAVALADLYVCDRVSQAAALGELRAARNAGLMNNGTPPELGQIVAGLHAGRTLESAITLCDLTGTGAQDTAIASHVYALARKAGIGTMIKS